jgi:hypothetical protein
MFVHHRGTETRRKPKSKARLEHTEMAEGTEAQGDQVAAA